MARKYKNITDEVAKPFRHIDNYFLALIKAEEIYNNLGNKYPGKYGLMWTITNLPYVGIIITVDSFADGVESHTENIYDPVLGELTACNVAID